jgi:hypothetical protein
VTGYLAMSAFLTESACKSQQDSDPSLPCLSTSWLPRTWIDGFRDA